MTPLVTVILIKTPDYDDWAKQAETSVRAQYMPCHLHVVQGTKTDFNLSRYANEGARHVDTKYIMRLDADDWLDPSCCLTMAAHLDANPDLDAVYSDYWETTAQMDEVWHATQPKIPHPACMMIRRDAFRALGGYDESLPRQEGTEFWQRFVKGGHKALHLAMPLWYRRLHGDNMSRKHNEIIRTRHDIMSKDEQQTKILTVIPARGGSKGVPNKNLRELAGLPLVSRAIRMVKQSRHDMLIAVCTDDPEIMTVAQDEGVEVLSEPHDLASDEVSTIPVLQWSMRYMDVHNWRADIVVTIQATGAFTPVSALDEALDAVLADRASCAVSVAEIQGTHPYRAFSRKNDGELLPLLPIESEMYLQRQDRPVFYGFTGGFYVRRRWLLEQWEGQGFALKNPHGVVVPPAAAVDIDTPLDWLVAETILKHKDRFL